MATNITELFGYHPSDRSAPALHARKTSTCPFVGGQCIKHFNDGKISGVCSLETGNGNPVICCPQRMYAGEYKILEDVAKDAFGDDCILTQPGDVKKHIHKGKRVVVFGKKWGKEVRLPKQAKKGSYFVDWILALIDDKDDLQRFVAVEVQTIDTTGNYRDEWEAYFSGKAFPGKTTAGFNWENVNKRILPQLIYKGHLLRREPLCDKGLYFVCPEPVWNKIQDRLGTAMAKIHPSTGSLTFKWYQMKKRQADGNLRALHFVSQLTTTVEQVSHAFSDSAGLLEPGVYEKAIKEALRD